MVHRLEAGVLAWLPVPGQAFSLAACPYLSEQLFFHRLISDFGSWSSVARDVVKLACNINKFTEQLSKSAA
jgi:hypothetical protein